MRHTHRPDWPVVLLVIVSALVGAATTSMVLDSPAPAVAGQPVVAPRPQLPEPAPPVGWTTSARVVSVYDADTVVIEIRRELRVRLLECWAPEIRTRDQAEKIRGYAARDFARALIPEGSPVTLHVPAHGAELAQVWSMGRVLGSLWIPGDDRPLARRIVEAGHATATKDGD